MRYVINKHKRRFVHISDEGQPLWKVRCGAWTFYGAGYLTDLEIVPYDRVLDYHQCRKCTKRGVGAWPTFAPTPTSHEHRWELIDEKTLLVRCKICGTEGYK